MPDFKSPLITLPQHSMPTPFMWSCQQTLKSLINEFAKKTTSHTAPNPNEHAAATPEEKKPLAEDKSLLTAAHTNNTVATKYTVLLKKISKLKIVLLIVFVISNLFSLLIFFIVRRMKTQSAVTTNRPVKPSEYGNTPAIILGLLGILNGAIPTMVTTAVLR